MKQRAKLKESELAVLKNKKEAFDRTPENIKTSLENKTKKHNEEVGDNKSKRTDKYILAVVYWRGVGAYKQNPESVRPSVVSAEQWGLGRVNGFLYALKKGKFKVKPYDTDLLPKGHPLSSRSVSNFNNDIKLAPIETPWAWESGGKEDTLGDNDWKTFKKAHAWFDIENLESVSGYRLPFAKVIDGELQVVFRGVASAMGALLRNIKGQDPKQSLDGINKSEYKKIYDLLSKYYDKFNKDAPEYIEEEDMNKSSIEDIQKEVDNLIIENREKEITDFPKRGDDKKVSLRNSQWELFPVDFAEKIKNEYPSIWKKGGNILGNTQYSRLTNLLEKGGVVETETDEKAVRLREAWVARHYKDFRIAGVIAQIKWLAVGSRGLKYMKDLVREEMKKVDEKKRTFNSDEFEVLSQTGNKLSLKSKEPMEWSMYVDHLETRKEVRAENFEIQEEDDFYVVSGLASSTSLDSHGTEMSLSALNVMKEQIDKGVCIVPRHETLTGGNGIPEWDEVLGMTVNAEIQKAKVKANQEDGLGYTLKVTFKLYKGDSRTENLVKRLRRGELIGLSIGGWFERVVVIEVSEDECRFIVEDVTLDHIAITRAPSNPDTYGLSILSARSKLNNFLRSSVMDKKEEITKEEERAETGDATVDVQAENPISKVERADDMPMDKEEEMSSEEEVEDKAIKEDDETEDIEEKAKKEEMEKYMKEYMKKYMEEKALEEKGIQEDYDKLKEKYMKLEEELKSLKEKGYKEEESVEKSKTEVKESVTIEDKEDKVNLSKDKKVDNIEKEIDTRNKLDHDLDNKNNSEQGEKMTKEEMVELAGLIARSMKSVDEKAEVKETKIETKDESVEALRSELAKTQEMLAKVMRNPVRRGRHITTTISGVGAKGAFNELITRSRSEGQVALSSVVEHNIDKLENDKIASMTSHELRSLLSAGLNAAQKDGILGREVLGWE